MNVALTPEQQKYVDGAKLALFMHLTGCSCFLCHCNDWQHVTLGLDEFGEVNGSYNIPPRIMARERAALNARMAPVLKRPHVSEKGT